MTFLEKVQKAKDLITEQYKLHPDITIGCSFGKDSLVTLHLTLQVHPNISVFGVMANTEFDETYLFAEKVAKDWGITYKEYRFAQVPEAVEDRSLCCGQPKIEATKKAVKDVSAWISGVRKTEGITRSDFEYVEKKGTLIKVNPILEFTELDIWRYTALYNIPVNPKYREGYRSLGCKLCSNPEEDENETERAGRWKGTAKVCGECGIHTAILK